MLFTTQESYWQENCSYYDSRVVIYTRKIFIRLATGVWNHSSTSQTELQSPHLNMMIMSHGNLRMKKRVDYYADDERDEECNQEK